MSKLTEWKTALNAEAPGWDEARWNAALADTIVCRDKVKDTAGSIQRMVAYIRCRRGKKVPV